MQSKAEITLGTGTKPTKPNDSDDVQRERCFIDPDVLTHIGFNNQSIVHDGIVGQIRIWVGSKNTWTKATQFALFTAIPDQSVGSGKALLYQKGMEKLGLGGSSTSTTCVVTMIAPNSSVSPTTLHDRSEFGEESYLAKDKKAIIIAPHGGDIDMYTHHQANEAVTALQALGKDVSKWVCQGYKNGGGAHDRWHITATDINPISFPLLNQIITNMGQGYKYAVAFHGNNEPGLEGTVIIGGSAPFDMLKAVRDAIREMPPIKTDTQTPVKVCVAKKNGAGGWELNGDDCDLPAMTDHFNKYSGDSCNNILNRLSPNGGIQIEQALEVRQNHYGSVGGGVIEILGNLLSQ